MLYFICAFGGVLKTIYEQMHGMESFKTNKDVTTDGILCCKSLNYQLHVLHTLNM